MVDKKEFGKILKALIMMMKQTNYMISKLDGIEEDQIVMWLKDPEIEKLHQEFSEECEKLEV